MVIVGHERSHVFRCGELCRKPTGIKQKRVELPTLIGFR
jgi:hypothetical protein